MSFDETYAGTYRLSATATTNPDPSTLTPSNPYPDTYVDRFTARASWVSNAATKTYAIVPLGTGNGGGEEPIELAFFPQSGSAVTYDVTGWTYVRGAAEWATPDDTGTQSLTGNRTLRIEKPGTAPWIIELSNVSGGAVDIYFNNAVARLL